jgi:hypothetical protein
MAICSALSTASPRASIPSRLPLAWLIKQVLAGPPGRRADVVDITAEVAVEQHPFGALRHRQRRLLVAVDVVALDGA